MRQRCQGEKLLVNTQDLGWENIVFCMFTYINITYIIKKLTSAEHVPQCYQLEFPYTRELRQCGCTMPSCAKGDVLMGATHKQHYCPGTKQKRSKWCIFIYLLITDQILSACQNWAFLNSIFCLRNLNRIKTQTLTQRQRLCPLFSPLLYVLLSKKNQKSY